MAKNGISAGVEHKVPADYRGNAPAVLLGGVQSSMRRSKTGQLFYNSHAISNYYKILDDRSPYL